MRVAYVTSDDVRLNVEIEGPDDAPTVVLVHGLASSIALGWRAPGVLDRLAAAGLRTVAYDARGHGHSDKPHAPDHYGDARLMLDLAEVVQGFAGPDTVVAGYSMGAATVLLALSVGLEVRASVLGATPAAVLGWTDADEQQRASAIAVLEGRAEPDADMLLWIDFLGAIRADKAALAACLRGHSPVVASWDRIAGPVVVAAGADDAAAAPVAELLARLPGATAIELAGDHYSAVADPAFTDAIVTLRVADGSPFRYRSADEDSACWLDFPFRAGDIVISTRSKSGTTWVQMICALLVFQTPALPAPLGEISPWLDWLGEPRDHVNTRLAAQDHRRFVKTHTPLDGIPIDARATYIVVARHPLDMAVSLYHQGDNLDRERISELTGKPAPPADAPRPSLPDWLQFWVDWDPDPREQMDSLPGVMAHVVDAWARRGEPNIVLVHYDDPTADLEGEMRRIAGRLEVEVPETRWPDLVGAAGFEQMRARAGRLAPDAAGVLKDPARFFRRGTSGAAREILADAALDHYEERARRLAAPEVRAWLHRPDPRK